MKEDTSNELQQSQKDAFEPSSPCPDSVRNMGEDSENSESSSNVDELSHHNTKTDPASELQQSQSHEEWRMAIEELAVPKAANTLTTPALESPADARDITTPTNTHKILTAPGKWILEMLSAVLRGLKMLVIYALILSIIAYAIWVAVAGGISAICILPVAQRSISVCELPVVSQTEFGRLVHL